MISFNLQLILIILSILLLIFFVIRIKTYKIELKYTILWIFIIFINIILAFFPIILSYISKMLYIETPANALFLFALFACFMILYNLTASMSKYSIKIKQLTQEVGLLKNELDKLREDNEEN